LEMVDLLIEFGADINAKSAWPAGGFGILEGVDPDVAPLLIDRGVVVDIWAAAHLNDLARAASLLDETPDLVRARGGDGKHPIHYAASPEMVDLLVERGADVNARDIDHGSTPVQYLVNNEHVVRRLLDHGAEPDIYLAAALGDVEMARHCIERDPSCLEARLGSPGWTSGVGGDIYKWTLGHDLTPQDVARDKGHTAALGLLLRRASPARQLAHATWFGDRKAASGMVAKDPGVVRRLMDVEPALMSQAAWWHRTEAVKILLEIGFDPHLMGVHESTPLDRAAFHGYAEMVVLILEADPDPPVSFRNEFGGTPLRTCIYGSMHGWDTGHPRDHVASARALIEAGCSFSSDWLPTGNPAMDRLLNEYLAS
ncbi:MAG: ankyrin repeat domain-containing protein, partial [Rhodothermales bacterium]|nr:ankyrin repeat domain-containing protein [Rhodothermales bacterium]